MKQNITQVAGHRRVKVGPWKVMVDFIGSRPSTLRVQIMRRVSPTNMKVVPSTEIVNIYIPSSQFFIHVWYTRFLFNISICIYIQMNSKTGKDHEYMKLK